MYFDIKFPLKKRKSLHEHEILERHVTVDSDAQKGREARGSFVSQNNKKLQ